MIYGIGIDLIEISRVEGILNRNNKFIERILTESEMQFLPANKNRKLEYVSGRFAGKEAVAKALGTGIGKEISWHDIEILNYQSGQPYIKLNSDKYLEEDYRFHISISHTKTNAIAKVIIEYY